MRVTPLGQDRVKRDYWLFGGKDWRLYVRDRGLKSRRGPALYGAEGTPVESDVCEEGKGQGLEVWGFYDQPEQIDGLLGYLFQNGAMAPRPGNVEMHISCTWMRCLLGRDMLLLLLLLLFFDVIL